MTMKRILLLASSFIASNLHAIGGITSSGATQFVAQMLPFILIAVVFYFFIIRPQTQRRKAIAQMIENLKVGDKVITTAGIIGTIFKIEENAFILELFDGNKIEILKGAITSMVNEQQN